MSSEAERPKIDLVRLAGITSGLPEGFTPRCPRCRYDLTGLEKPTCPECGAPFSIAVLLAEWRARKARPPSNADYIAAGLLAFVSFWPADLRDPAVLVWKMPAVLMLWMIVWLCATRHREEHLEHGHRLLLMWVPCVATAIGVSPTPDVNLVVGAAMALIAVWSWWVAWRRSPQWTAILASVVLTLPAALAVVGGLGIVTTGAAERAQGHYWSFADYPSWYWKNTPGRSRGVNNADAEKFGGYLVGGGIAVGLALVPMWVKVGRTWRRELRAYRERQSGKRRW